MSILMFSFSAFAFKSCSYERSSPSGVASVIFFSLSCSSLMSAPIFISADTQNSLLFSRTVGLCSADMHLERQRRLQSANRLWSITSYLVERVLLIFLRQSKHFRKLSLMASNDSVRCCWLDCWPSPKAFISYFILNRRAYSIIYGCLARWPANLGWSMVDRATFAENTLLRMILMANSLFFQLNPPISWMAACRLSLSSLLSILSMVGWQAYVENEDDTLMVKALKKQGVLVGQFVNRLKDLINILGSIALDIANNYIYTVREANRIVLI